MTMEYVNRRGDRYFVPQGKTKTGKPKYYCSKRTDALGVSVERLPEDYEIHENPEPDLVVRPNPTAVAKVNHLIGPSGRPYRPRTENSVVHRFSEVANRLLDFIDHAPRKVFNGAEDTCIIINYEDRVTD